MLRFKKIFALLCIAIIICFLFPIFKVGSTTYKKPDWFFIFSFIAVIPVIWRFIERHSLLFYFFVLYLVILLLSVFSELYGSYMYLGSVLKTPPIYSLLVLEKLSVFTLFFYIVRTGGLKTSLLLTLISTVFLVALTFGVFQFFNFMSAGTLALDYYLQSDVQTDNFLRFRRIIGVAPAIITWSGCCILIFHYFWHFSQSKIIMTLGMLLSLLNVAMAASRSGIVALITSIFLIQLVKAIIIDKNGLSVVRILLVTAFLLGATYFALDYYMPEQIGFLMRRFEDAGYAMTKSGRGDQLSYFTELLLLNPVNLLFGVGKSVIDNYGYLEVEPAYILTTTGLVGFVAHYLIIFLLLRKAYSLRKYKPEAFLFIWGAAIGYLIFSIGFYFFYELYMGTVFWWVTGCALGMLVNEQKKQSSCAKSIDHN